jgi:site-specific recombinase XerD
MLTISFCGDSYSADWCNKAVSELPHQASSHLLCEGARPEIVRDILGHVDIRVTQNLYGKEL